MAEPYTDDELADLDARVTLAGEIGQRLRATVAQRTAFLWQWRARFDGILFAQEMAKRPDGANETRVSEAIAGYPGDEREKHAFVRGIQEEYPRAHVYELAMRREELRPLPPIVIEAGDLWAQNQRLAADLAALRAVVASLVLAGWDAAHTIDAVDRGNLVRGILVERLDAVTRLLPTDPSSASGKVELWPTSVLFAGASVAAGAPSRGLVRRLRLSGCPTKPFASPTPCRRGAGCRAWPPKPTKT